jgi:DNA-binding response OmpR family regulator
MEPKPTILVINQMRILLHFLRTNLRRAGFEVLTARTDEEARQIATDRLPDITVHLDDEEDWSRLKEFVNRHRRTGSGPPRPA